MNECVLQKEMFLVEVRKWKMTESDKSLRISVSKMREKGTFSTQENFEFTFYLSSNNNDCMDDYLLYKCKLFFQKRKKYSSVPSFMNIFRVNVETYYEKQNGSGK